VAVSYLPLCYVNISLSVPNLRTFRIPRPPELRGGWAALKLGQCGRGWVLRGSNPQEAPPCARDAHEAPNAGANQLSVRIPLAIGKRSNVSAVEGSLETAEGKVSRCSSNGPSGASPRRALQRLTVLTQELQRFNPNPNPRGRRRAWGVGRGAAWGVGSQP
jgi:hypothetical protein